MSNEAQVRTAKVKKNVILTALAKGLSMAISFLYVPLLLHSMDTGRYGVWLTLTSIISWISLFDIGLGNGLRNRLSESLAKRDVAESRKYVSTAYVSIFAIGAALILLTFTVGTHINWNSVVNARQPAIPNLDLLALIVLSGFCLNFAFGLINSVLYAKQKSGIISMLNLLSQGLTFLIVLLLVKGFNISSLLILGSTISLVPPLVLIVFTVCFFTLSAPELRPSLRYFDKRMINDIVFLGLKFFIISIITIVLFQTNSLILTHTLGAAAVVEYNICYKYMYISVTLFAMICIPIWSAATEAYVKDDTVWIHGIKQKLIKISAAFGLLGLLQVILSKLVFKIWIGSDCPDIPYTTTAILLLYVVGMNCYAAYGYIINGIGKLWMQIICSSIIALAYLPSAYFSSLQWGLNGLLLTMCAVPWLNFAWSYVQYHKLIGKTATGLWNK